MGAAAYRRGSEVIAKQLERDFAPTPTAFRIMDRMNALPKAGSIKRVPFVEKLAIEFDSQRGVWWLMDAENMYEGHSRWYLSLEKLITAWDIYLTGYDETTGVWTAEAI
jgi:hypothetical protein